MTPPVMVNPYVFTPPPGPSTYSAAVLADSPAWYSRLGDTSGTTMTDASGNGHNGTYGTAVTLNQAGATGDGDRAILSTISLGDSTVPYASPLFDVTTAITLECWMNFTSTSLIVAMARAQTSAAYGALLYGSSGKIGGNINTSSNLSVLSPLTYNDGSWHHAAITYDGTTIRLYVDGSQVATTAQTGNVLSGTNPNHIIHVGGRSGTNFNGYLDEAAYYTTTLSAARVAAHYAAR